LSNLLIQHFGGQEGWATVAFPQCLKGTKPPPPPPHTSCLQWELGNQDYMYRDGE